MLLAKPQYGTSEVGIVDAFAPEIEQEAMIAAAEPDRGNRKVRELRALHRGIDADYQKVVIGKGRSDVVFLEPVGLDEIAGKGDRLLLILRRKEQLAHALSQAREVFQRFPVAGQSRRRPFFCKHAGANRDVLVLFRNGRDLEVMPATLFEQTTCQIVFMQPLHDHHDRTLGF